MRGAQTQRERKKERERKRERERERERKKERKRERTMEQRKKEGEVYLANLEHDISELRLGKQLFAVFHQFIQIHFQIFKHHMKRVIFTNHFFQFHCVHT